jgi:hypothetical protein
MSITKQNGHYDGEENPSNCKCVRPWNGWFRGEEAHQAFTVCLGEAADRVGDVCSWRFGGTGAVAPCWCVEMELQNGVKVRIGPGISGKEMRRVFLLVRGLA